MARTHHYELDITWTGDRGTGTSGYRDFDRAHEVTADGKPLILASADPALRGDRERWNPEEFLVAALAQCHMLWFLHLCVAEKVIVTSYTDRPHGTMTETADGGHFEEVVLRPRVTVATEEQAARTAALHERAHQMCFIANSVNFPVRQEPIVEVAPNA
ncbi:OsmC family protein [Actinomadura verrucosospora]|uniref:Redox protein, regulator of disulfide bond formation n=1 Tax=Actinomadura verrucosospora TaxID=46165 RepID=A0A7D4AQC1_ACTVE|nr:OsmC family protein [Actinomadura verrucosospora]QKG22569.1 redox protein, regulator of disulfide bond formation [Actinomadura verrucosospora]